MAGTARKVSCSMQYLIFLAIFPCYFVVKHSNRSFKIRENGLFNGRIQAITSTSLRLMELCDTFVPQSKNRTYNIEEGQQHKLDNQT